MCKSKKELDLERRKKEFIEKANLKHNFEFDYSNINFVNSSTPIEIGCKKCGSFCTQPQQHLKGTTCKECGNKRKRDKLSMTTEEYIKDCSKKHNGYYSYPNTIYTVSTAMVKIECPLHGEVEVQAGNHRRGACCTQCGNEASSEKRVKGKEKFVEQAKLKHKEAEYNYDKFIYVNNKTHGIITCKHHGDFESRPDMHLHKNQGCPSCANERTADLLRQTPEEFLEKLIEKRGNDGYTFDKVNYECSTCKITVTCNRYGDFDVRPYNFLNGTDHPLRANSNTSRPEQELFEYVKSLYPEALNNKYGIIGRKELDIYIPELNKAIEYNGYFWHYDQRNKNCKPKGYHAMKSNLCRDKGIKLLHIREDLWLRDKEFMKERVKVFLELPNK